MERLVYDQLVAWLNLHSILDPLQTGFRKGHSTQTTLLKFTDDIRFGIGMLTIAVIFDFSKAFDTVCHVTLLQKLADVGLSASALKWFTSYLCGRSQAVRLGNGAMSEWTAVSSGVPQGSVLGPLLFSLFLGDLPASIRECSYLLYADDLVIYYQCLPSNLHNALARVNGDIASIQGWSSCNSLSLNSTKTKAMVLGSLGLVSRVDLTLLPPPPRMQQSSGLC